MEKSPRDRAQAGDSGWSSQSSEGFISMIMDTIRRKCSQESAKRLLVPRTAKDTDNQEKILSLDPSFESFDYEAYEDEIMSYKALKNYDLKSIVAKSPGNRKCPGDGGGFVTKSSSIEILKAAPKYLDENNNKEIPSSSTQIHSELKRNRSKKNNGKPKKYDEHSLCQYQCQAAGESCPLPVGSSSISADLRQCIEELGSAYALQSKMITESHGGQMDKLVKLVGIYESWISDLYEENFVMVDVLDELDYDASVGMLENESDFKGLQSKFLEVCKDVKKWKAKVEEMELESTQKDQSIKKVTDALTQLKQSQFQKDTNGQKVQQDLDALIQLLVRLRDGGIWDINGIKISPELFAKVFGSTKHLHGTKLEWYDDLNTNKKGLSEEIFAMRQEREHLRAKLFSKERHLNKMRTEEEAVRHRLAVAKAEEGALMHRIANLKSEEVALREIATEEDYSSDDFQKD